jgi:hypothetical protein
MSNLTNFLTEINVKLEDVLLDPNNPRFAELGEEAIVVPYNRYKEEKIQKQAYDRMKDKNFDVVELRDTIKSLGFLPMDRIVVSKWEINDSNKYVTIEGNRRIAALKWLIELHEIGRETFTQEQLDNFKKLNVLLLDNKIAPEEAKLILPGLRHISGIKAWGPYQQAKVVHTLRSSGKSPQEAAQSVGLKTRRANLLWRSYLALEQMKNDEEYSEHTNPKQYSYFEEVFNKPNMRNWLKWDDIKKEFTENERLREFYSWIVSELNEDGELMEPKLPKAISIRDLAVFINDDFAMNSFRGHKGSLVKAMATYESEHKEQWQPIIKVAENALAGLTPDSLRSITVEDIEVIYKLKSRVEQVIADFTKLTGRNCA